MSGVISSFNAFVQARGMSERVSMQSTTRSQDLEGDSATSKANINQAKQAFAANVQARSSLPEKQGVMVDVVA